MLSCLFNWVTGSFSDPKILLFPWRAVGQHRLLLSDGTRWSGRVAVGASAAIFGATLLICWVLESVITSYSPFQSLRWLQEKCGLCVVIKCEECVGGFQRIVRMCVVFLWKQNHLNQETGLRRTDLKVTSAVCADVLFTRTCTSDLSNCTRLRALSSAGLSWNEKHSWDRKKTGKNVGREKVLSEMKFLGSCLIWNLWMFTLRRNRCASQARRRFLLSSDYERFLLRL